MLLFSSLFRATWERRGITQKGTKVSADEREREGRDVPTSYLSLLLSYIASLYKPLRREVYRKITYGRYPLRDYVANLDDLPPTSDWLIYFASRVVFAIQELHYLPTCDCGLFY
jgi:hypothetical protein